MMNRKLNRILLRGVLVAFLALSSLAFSSEQSTEDGVSIYLRGYYKNILSRSETTAGNTYLADMNRFRLEIDSRMTPELSAKIIYDNEAILGTVLTTPEFNALKLQEEDARYDLDKVLSDTSDVYWKHSLYRGYATYAMKRVTLVAGRQRVALGVGKIWSPEDIINPVNPLSVERDERTGADAVNLDFHISSFSGISFIYAARKSENDVVTRAKANFKGYDCSVMGGKFGNDSVLGFDYSGNIKDSGFRGEAIYTFAREREDYLRYVFSWDYTFSNSFMILLEYFYNGGNTREDIPLSPLANGVATKNRKFLGVGTGYDITPLIRYEDLAIIDPEGRSLYWVPTIKYNFVQNIDWLVGAQLFWASPDSEFGGFSNVYYSQLQWFF